MSKNILIFFCHLLWADKRYVLALQHKQFERSQPIQLTHVVVSIRYYYTITAYICSLFNCPFITRLILCTMRLMPVNKHQVPKFKIVLIIAIWMTLSKNYSFYRVVPLSFGLEAYFYYSELLCTEIVYPFLI